MPYVASAAVDDTDETVGPAVLIVKALLVDTKAPPDASVILFVLWRIKGGRISRKCVSHS